MAKQEIVEKLNNFLAMHSPISEECHAMYVMVQLRKLLDHDQDHWQRGSFTLLRFYCDWTVHTEKDKITESIKSVMDEVFEDAKQQIENPGTTGPMSPVMKFAYMENLREEMRKYLQKRGIDTSITTQQDAWVTFIGFLVKVLENQPIHNPNNNISLFQFTPAADRCVRGVIYFKIPIRGYTYYNFANAY